MDIVSEFPEAVVKGAERIARMLHLKKFGRSRLVEIELPLPPLTVRMPGLG